MFLMGTFLNFIRSCLWRSKKVEKPLPICESKAVLVQFCVLKPFEGLCFEFLHRTETYLDVASVVVK